MAQYVYTMQGVTKVVPPQRTILQNINLSFFPGAKIGVLGLNGSGKSSLLRIMAGQDTEIDGEARAQKDIRVGYLPQEPGLDDDLDVRGNVELGVASIMAILKEYNEISDRFAEPMEDDEMTKLLERQGDLATEIDAVDGWEIDRTLDIAADALRLPAWDTPVVSLSGGERRRVALCALLLSNQTCYYWTNPPTIWMLKVCPGWSASRRIPRHRCRGDPRSLLPRQRYELDS